MSREIYSDEKNFIQLAHEQSFPLFDCCFCATQNNNNKKPGEWTVSGVYW